MGIRRKAREFALQFMFQIDVAGGSPEADLEAFWTVRAAPVEAREFARDLVAGAWGRLAEIDALIAACAENWALDRMAVVDRNLLRLAVYEMLFMGRTPPIVVIDEAVDIAKKYSTPDSGAFVNGILDRIRRERLGDDSGGERPLDRAG
ncbi:MAG: transcription antitermination factor NusB [bacterium]|nr:transcription antitermination factor NusB [bacterium]